MLSSVLHSEVAIQVSISIMDAFVSMRHLLSNSRKNSVEKLQDDIIQLKKYLEETFKDYNDINEGTRKELDNIYLAIAALSVKQPPKPFWNGQATIFGPGDIPLPLFETNSTRNTCCWVTQLSELFVLHPEISNFAL